MGISPVAWSYTFAKIKYGLGSSVLLIKCLISIYQQDIISINDESLALLSEERPQCQVAATHSFKCVWEPSPSHSSLILTLHPKYLDSQRGISSRGKFVQLYIRSSTQQIFLSNYGTPGKTLGAEDRLKTA